MATRPFQPFGQRLRKLRARLRNSDGTPVSQAELARRCGWNRLDQWRYEDGRVHPGAERLAALAKALRVTIEVLLESDAPRRPNSPNRAA